MKYPISIYYFKQAKPEPNNCTGRYDLYRIDGDKIPALIHTMIRKPNTGKKTISVYKNKKGELALSNPSLGKTLKNLFPELNIDIKATNISRLAGTDIDKANIRLYGDIQILNNPILVDFDFNPETKERLLKIMVFKGGDEQALSLYHKRHAGQIKESTADNNKKFGTGTVLSEVNNGR